MTPDRAEYLARLAESIVVDLRKFIGEPIDHERVAFVRDLIRREVASDDEAQWIMSRITIGVGGGRVVRFDEYVKEVLS